jgi:CelD/BcsL family acetyltransferase involved in cellulose biosynthesis
MPALSASRVECLIEPATDLAESDLALWEQLRLVNPTLASPFLAADFTRIAAKIVPKSFVAKFTRHGEIIGFFPFQRRSGAIYPLGSPLSDVHGVICAPENTLSFDQVFELLGKRSLKVLNWVGSIEGAIEHQTLLAVMPERGFEGWQAQQNAKHHRFFKDKARGRRNFQAELGEIVVETGVRESALLDHMIDLKRQQYLRTGHHDIFSCHWTRDLLHALMAHEGKFGASMAIKNGGGKRVAFEYALHDGTTYHFWFPAYEPEFSRFSPGILLTLDTMSEMAKRGYTIFNFGQSGAAYKNYFCNDAITLYEASRRSSSIEATLGGQVARIANAVRPKLGDRLAESFQRRWASIEACEPNFLGQVRGVTKAVAGAVRKVGSAAA